MREDADRPLGNLDELLDCALASYTPVTPRLGLAERVHARLAASAQPARRSVFLPFVWTVTGTFAVAIVLAVLLQSHTVSSSQSNAAILAVPSAITDSAQSEIAPPAPSRLIHRSRIPHFHTRQPTQQQLIAQLLANGPEAIASLASAEEEQEKPIEIKPLVVDPLVIEPIKTTPIEDNSAKTGGTL
jgi:hypothetical protein